MTGPKPAGAAMALVLAALTAGCAGEALEPRETSLSLYDTWDTNRDSLLDTQEFAAGPYHSWYSTTYDAWDIDRDGLLSEEEFGASTAAWLGDSDIGDFGAWDADGDGSIDSSEFYDGLAG